jgi:hypothetical protein
MNTLKIKRGATVNQTLYYSIEKGQFTCLLVDHIKEDGQQVCYSPAKIITSVSPIQQFIIEDGVVQIPSSTQNVEIVNLWYKYVLSPTGKILELATDSMRVNKQDTSDIITALGKTMTCQIINGRIRKINGFNLMPVFAGDTTTIVYELPEDAEADNSYDDESNI